MGLDTAKARDLLLAHPAMIKRPLLDNARGQPWVLHPVHRAAGAADRRAATQSAFDAATGSFRVPGRTAVVFVVAR